jgi:hypothetical protein
MPPNVPQDITDVIAGLQRQIDALKAAVGQRPAMNEIAGGDVTVLGGGALRVKTTDGSATQLLIGKVLPNHVDGSEQRGIIFAREDGSQALTLVTTTAAPQALAIRDHLGVTVFADDATADGLARPYLSTDAWWGATEVPAYTTTSATFAALQHLPWVRQHPRVTGHFLVKSDATTAGEIRLVDDSGTVIAGPLVVAANTFTYGSLTGPVAGAFGFATYLHWQARVTSGPGSIGVRGLSTFGVQS